MSAISNQIRTAVLLGLLTGLLLFAGSILGGRQGLFIGLIFAILMNFGSYWFSDKIVLKMYKAKEIKENENSYIYNIAKEVANMTNIPLPKLFIIPSMQANAFATGRNPKHSAVAVTQGMLDLLDKQELKAVIAHEMAHIKNRDTLIQAVAATIAGVISYLAFFARLGALFGGMRDRDSGEMLQMLALAIITPIMAMIIQMAISRSREYLADSVGSSSIHNPYALASALEKISSSVNEKPMRFGNHATSSLFIANPFSAKGMMNLLSTHPPIEERIKKLRSM